MRALDFSTGWSADGAPESESTFTIANNQSTTNITGLTFSSATYRAVVIEFEIKRISSTDDLRAIILAKAVYSGYVGEWRLAGAFQEDLMENGSDHGVTLSVTTAGQWQYATSNMGGTGYAGTMKINVLRRYNA